MEGDKVRIGIVGAGAVVRRGHLPAFKSLHPIKVEAIVDVNVELAKNVANEFEIPRVFKSHRELIENLNLDIIDVCTPPQERYEIIKDAAEAGVHILVEKPLALTLEEALKIKEAIERNSVKLCIVRNYRYFPAVKECKRRIKEGKLGRIVSIYGLATIPFPSDITRSTWLYHHGGVLYDFTPHLIDMILWLNDYPKVKEVHAVGGDFTGGDMGFINYAQILMKFENRTVATADVSWLTGITRFFIYICGIGGQIFLDVRNNNFMEIHGFLTPLNNMKTFLKESSLIKDILTGRYFSGAALFYKEIILEFINNIRSGTPPAAPIEQGVIESAILETAKKKIVNAL